MLVHGSSLLNLPVLSLHVGRAVARVTSLVIDPDNLKLIAFRVDGPQVGGEVGDILPIESVREFSSAGLIIDSIDELVEESEVVHIEKVLGLHFSLIGLKVITKKKKSKLGKITGFTIDLNSWSVAQIIVARPLLKSFLDPELIISRQKIVEVTDYEVIIKEESEKTPANASAPAEFTPNFVNPFRKPEFATRDQEK